VTNVAVVGQQLGHMVVAAPTTVDPLFIPGETNVVVVEGGTNDFAQGQTVANVEILMQQYCSGRKAVGFKCVPWTMLSRKGNNPVGGETLDADKNALNIWLRANWPSFADGLVDFAGTPYDLDGGYSNSTWYQNDGIHPTELGVTSYQLPLVGAAINKLQ
jgi:hypothetical protein